MHGMNPYEIAQTCPMMSWRLRDRMNSQVKEFVSQFECIIRAGLEQVLLNTNAPGIQINDYRDFISNKREIVRIPMDLKIIDSIGFGNNDPPWMLENKVEFDKQHPDYPRMIIENRCYFSKAFRKIHIEIVHIVMYPNFEYELPLLSMDMVAYGDEISFIVIDPTPCRMDRSLPELYQLATEYIQDYYYLPENNRDIPEWGSKIFSDKCVIQRPNNEEDVDTFMDYALDLSKMHVMYATLQVPVALDSPIVKDGIRSHIRFCKEHHKNRKTLLMLEKSFGQQFAEQYMKDFMFDCPPTQRVDKEYQLKEIQSHLYRIFSVNIEKIDSELEFMPSNAQIEAYQIIKRMKYLTENYANVQDEFYQAVEARNYLNKLDDNEQQTDNSKNNMQQNQKAEFQNDLTTQQSDQQNEVRNNIKTQHIEQGQNDGKNQQNKDLQQTDSVDRSRDSNILNVENQQGQELRQDEVDYNEKKINFIRNKIVLQEDQDSFQQTEEYPYQQLYYDGQEYQEISIGDTAVITQNDDTNSYHGTILSAEADQNQVFEQRKSKLEQINFADQNLQIQQALFQSISNLRDKLAFEQVAKGVEIKEHVNQLNYIIENENTEQAQNLRNLIDLKQKSWTDGLDGDYIEEELWTILQTKLNESKDGGTLESYGLNQILQQRELISYGSLYANLPEKVKAQQLDDFIQSYRQIQYDFAYTLLMAIIVFEYYRDQYDFCLDWTLRHPLGYSIEYDEVKWDKHM